MNLHIPAGPRLNFAEFTITLVVIAISAGAAVGYLLCQLFA